MQARRPSIACLTPVSSTDLRLLLVLALMSCVPRVRVESASAWKEADELLSSGELEEAAQKFTQLVDADPHFELADRALSNAAVCHELREQFDQARALYERILSEYPGSKLADGALYLAALNAERAQDFDRAIARYQQLVKQNPASPHCQPAVVKVVRILEALRRYREAAPAYVRYAELFPHSGDAPRYLLRGAILYEQLGDSSAEFAALTAFLRRYSRIAGKDEVARTKARLARLPSPRPDPP